MTTKYGPRIAHQGGSECPCDRYAAGRVWYVGDTKENNYVLMLEADWSDVLVYQLVEEPLRETVEYDALAIVGFSGKPVITRFKYQALPDNAVEVRVRVTTNLEDGKPVSGSWEAVE